MATLTAKVTLTDSSATYSSATSTPVTMTLPYTESSYVLVSGTQDVNLGGTMESPKFIMIRAIEGSGTVTIGGTTTGTDTTNIDSTGGFIILSCQTGQDLSYITITESVSLTTEIIAYQ